MKIIFPCSYYLPERAASLYLTDHIVHACAENDIDVMLYTPTPTRSVPANTTWERNEIQCNGKIKIHRFHLFQEGKNPFLRAFRYFLGEIYFLHKCIWTKYDGAFIDSTPPIQGLKNPIIKLMGKRVIYNAQDIFPDSLSGTGLAKKGGLLWKIGSVVEKITYKYSDKIIVISEDFKRNLMEKGVPEEKIVVVYNWVDENAVVPIDDENNPLFEEFGINREKFRVVYAGNLGNAQNIDVILDAAKGLVENTDIEFIIFGTGGRESEIRSRIENEHLNNVKLLPLQPVERVPYVYGLGNVCVVSCKTGLGGSAMPSKTWSIMASGRAVLANFDEGELKQILEENNCGVFTQAGDVNTFRSVIVDLCEHRDLTTEMGRNGRNFILENLTKDVGTLKYISVIKEVIKK